MTKPLSPAAQAVIYAWSQIGYGKDVDETFRPLLWEHKALAAALRAAADQVVPPPVGDGLHDCCAGIIEQIRAEFLAIVAELGALSND